MKEFIEKLIGRLEEEKSKGYYDSDSVIGEKNCWNKAIEIVNELAEKFATDINVVSNNGWIPCSERFPDEEGWYLVYTKPDKGYKSINKAQFRKGYEWNNFTPYWSGAGGTWGNVVGWMPLPQPYKEEGASNE